MVFKISEICKQYGDNIVLENISLELQGGKVHGDVYKRQAAASLPQSVSDTM